MENIILISDGELQEVEKKYIQDQGIDIEILFENSVSFISGYIMDDSSIAVRKSEDEIWIACGYYDGVLVYNPCTKEQWVIGVPEEYASVDAGAIFEEILCVAKGINCVKGDESIDDSNAVPKSVDISMPSMPETNHPFISDDVFEGLPKFLKSLVKLHNGNDRERDIILLGALGILSSCFPHHYGIYDNRIIASSLFIFISAPAASGKGVIGALRHLGSSIQNKLNGEYAEACEEYTTLLAEYNSTKEGNIPAKPQRKLFFIPANNSSSKIIEVMGANKNFGVLLETEADTLVQALKNDWGNFSDVIRKCFHHEPVEMQRKKDDEYISISKSFLSVILTGTPNQVSNLLSNIENGFFSRFLFYDYPFVLDWKNVFAEKDILPEIFIKSASTTLLEYKSKLEDFFATIDSDGELKIKFVLTPNQEKAFNEWFMDLEEIYIGACGVDFAGNIRRMGLICFRICMLLSIISEMENNVLHEEIVCDNINFNIACSISGCLLAHAAFVFDRITSASKFGLSAKQLDMYKFLDSLPNSFNAKKYLEVALSLNLKPKTAEYRIQKYIEEKRLVRESYGFYRKLKTN